MSDGEVRELGRRARADDDPEARVAWIVARLRLGLPRERLFLAAWAGDAAAARLLGRAAPRSPEGPLHVPQPRGVGPLRSRVRTLDAVAQNAGKHACLDLLCAALDAALAGEVVAGVAEVEGRSPVVAAAREAGEPRGRVARAEGSAHAVVAAARAWRVARGRIELRERAAALQRAVAALTGAAGLSAQTVVGVLNLPGSSRSQPWLDGPPPVQLAFASELILAIARDGSHRFGELAAHALRAVSAAANGAPAVDVAARAALIAFALR